MVSPLDIFSVIAFAMVTSRAGHVEPDRGLGYSVTSGVLGPMR